MLNIKSFSVINADKIQGNIHIVGVGALGSMIAEQLIRLNLTSKIIVYDMDIVEEKNLNNQAYFRRHIGMTKVQAMQDLAKEIDDEAKLRGKNKQVTSILTKSEDVVILAIDNFKARQTIIENLQGNPLLISGGVSSTGGSFETIRGKYKELAEELSTLKSGQEYDENDLTPCGSPISIYHRIRYGASLICEALIREYTNTNNFRYNTMYDVVSEFLIKE